MRLPKIVQKKSLALVIPEHFLRSNENSPRTEPKAKAGTVQMQQQQQSPAVSSARFKPPRASLERIDHHRGSSDHVTGSNMQLHSDSEDDVTGSGGGGRHAVTPGPSRDGGGAQQAVQVQSARFRRRAPEPPRPEQLTDKVSPV